MRIDGTRGRSRLGLPGTALAAILCLAVSDGLAAQTAGFHAQRLPSNHALLITVSEYQRSPLPGVSLDRETAVKLAARFGVPPENIVQLSEKQVTREGLRQALASMSQVIRPGDKLYVYFSGHGARFFSKATGKCTESLVMQDMHVVTNREFADMLKPLSARTDKTVVMLDSCHSGGVAESATTRGLTAAATALRPKFSAEASSPECAQAVNDGSFSKDRGVDLGTTDNNLVILAAARNNEVAWDTLDGGALTHNFDVCFSGDAKDSDRSGSISMQELADCVQARLDKAQKDDVRQHVTVTGNSALLAAFTDQGPGVGALSGSAAPGASSAQPVAVAQPVSLTQPGSTPAAAADPLATLTAIYSQRDDRWAVEASVVQPRLKIGSNLALSVHSQRDGFVYLFYQGTQPGSFYLLFPNQLDSANAIKADETLQLPRPDWSVTALGPEGTDHLMVMVTQGERDFSALSLPAQYVSQAGPFEKIQPTAQAAARIGQAALLSVAAGKDQCRSAAAKRDLGVARRCSNAFGAGLVSVEETP